MGLRLAVLALAAGLAGCGGGGHAAATPTPSAAATAPPSGGATPTGGHIALADYQGRADRLCAAFGTSSTSKLSDLQGQLSADGSFTFADAMQINATSVALLGPFLDRLNGLPEPDAKAAAALAFRRDLGGAYTALRDAVAAYGRHGRAPTLAALRRNRTLTGAARRKAAALGLKQCRAAFRAP
jgi:hypothetical protein